MLFDHKKDYNGKFYLKWFDNKGEGDEFSLPQNTSKIYKTNLFLTNITKITDLTDDITCEDDNFKIKKFFKYRNTCSNRNQDYEWSKTLPIEELIGMSVNPVYDFEIELMYFLDFKIPDTKKIHVNNIQLNGEYDTQIDEGSTYLSGNKREAILEFYDIYKIFNITKVEIIASATGDYTVEYRVTQNQGRTYTDWEYLTLINIQKNRIDSLRFCNFQYRVRLTGFGGDVRIDDIILSGEVQNISDDYKTSNRLGLRNEILKSKNNGKLPDDIITQQIGDNSDPYLELNTKTGKENFINFYDNTKIPKFAEMLSNQISDVLGWDVIYFSTDPDENGIDYAYHEYNLKNISSSGELHVVVPKNEFKQDNILLNKYNLELFNTFEVHITKNAFKSVFGIEKRPRKNDILFIPDVNKIYDIEHTFAFRGPMNAVIYYRVSLKKHQENKAINITDEPSKTLLESLTKNTTIDNLLGIEMREDEDKVSNIVQTTHLSIDKIRKTIFKGLINLKEKLYNKSIDFSHYQYDLSKMEKGKVSIDYKVNDNNFTKGDNRSIMMWFKVIPNYQLEQPITEKVFDEYPIDEKSRHNLICNYKLDDETDVESNGKGYRAWLKGKTTNFQINGEKISYNEDSLLRNVWYCSVTTLNQRSGKLELSLYRRQKNIHILMINMSTYQKITMLMYDKIENAYDIDDETYLYNDAILDGYRPYYNMEVEGEKTFDNQEETNECVSQAVKTANSCEHMEDFLFIGSNLNDRYIPQEFKHNQSLKLKGSEIQYTNLRIFDECIDKIHIHNILNENIIINSEELILGDNCNEELQMKNYWNKNYS